MNESETVKTEKLQRKFRTTIVISTDVDPTGWDLQSFYWAIQNGDADEVRRVRASPRIDLGKWRYTEDGGINGSMALHPSDEAESLAREVLREGQVVYVMGVVVATDVGLEDACHHG